MNCASHCYTYNKVVYEQFNSLKNHFSFLVLHVVLILYCETHIHYTIAVYTIKKFVLICICVIQPHKIFLVLGSFFSARAHYFYTQVCMFAGFA